MMIGQKKTEKKRHKMQQQSIYNLAKCDEFEDDIFGLASERQRRPNTSARTTRRPSSRHMRESESDSNPPIVSTSKRATLRSEGVSPVKHAWAENENNERIRVKVKPPIPFFRDQNRKSKQDDHCNFVELNRNSLWKQEVLNAPVKPRGMKHLKSKKLGIVPKYIEKRKIQLQQQRQEEERMEEELRIQQESKQGQLMPEKERLKLLKSLRVKRNETEFEYQRFSHTSFHGSQRRNYIDSLCVDMDKLDNMISQLESANVVVFPDE